MKEGTKLMELNEAVTQFCSFVSL